MLVVALAVAFSTSFMQRIVDLSDATISADGTRIAFVVSRVDESHNRYDDAVEVKDLRTGSTLLIGAPGQTVSNIAWSPTSDVLAAVISDAQHPESELFLIDPQTGKRTQLTKGAGSVSQIAWRPDGRALAVRRAEVTAPKTGADKYRDGFEVAENAYLSTSPPPTHRLWLVARSGDQHALTAPSHNVSDSPPSWSPDGSALVFEEGSAIYGLSDRATAVRLDVASGQTRMATAYRSEVDQASYSPDGKHIAYLMSQRQDLVNQVDCYVAAATGGGDRDICQNLDRWVDSANWLPSSQGLLVQINDAARQPLVIVKLDGTSLRLPMGQVIDAAVYAGPVSRDGTIVFVGTERYRPTEVYILRPGARAPRRVTAFNDAIAALDHGKVERMTWRSHDGQLLDGVLTYPVGYIPGRKYPLVLRIHGGPNETSTLSFYDWAQLAAAHGYLVLRPNYRGSTDGGARWVRAILNDPNEGPSEDIMAGIAALQNRGIVAPGKIGISGWSYGGQLTYWLETHHDFAAAVAGAGVSDLQIGYAIADDYDYERIMFDRYPTPFKRDALAVWRQQSAITYAANVHTPTLILCNVYDVRVPIVESYEMFRALRDNGVPVQFYAYPSSGHLPNGPVRTADVYDRWLRWFDRYLR